MQATVQATTTVPPSMSKAAGSGAAAASGPKSKKAAAAAAAGKAAVAAAKRPLAFRANSLEFEDHVAPLLARSANAAAGPSVAAGAVDAKKANPSSSPPRAGPTFKSTLSAAAKDFELISDDGKPSPQPPKRQQQQQKSKSNKQHGQHGQHPASSPRSRSGSGGNNGADVRSAMIAAVARKAAVADASADLHLREAAMFNHHAAAHQQQPPHAGGGPGLRAAGPPPGARGRNASVGAVPSQHHFQRGGGIPPSFHAPRSGNGHSQRQHMRPSHGAHGSHPHLHHLAGAAAHHNGSIYAPHQPHRDHGQYHAGNSHRNRSGSGSFNFDMPHGVRGRHHSHHQYHHSQHGGHHGHSHGHHQHLHHDPRDLRDAPVVQTMPRSSSPGIGDGPVDRLGDELLVSSTKGAAAGVAAASVAAASTPKRSVFDDQIGKGFTSSEQQQFRDNYLSPKGSIFDEHPALRDFAALHLAGQSQSQMSSPRHARNPYVQAHHAQYAHQRSGSLPLPLSRGGGAMQSAPSTLSRAGAPTGSGAQARAQALQHAAQAAAAVQAIHGHQTAQQLQKLQQRMQPLQKPPAIETAATTGGAGAAKTPSSASSGQMHLVQVHDAAAPSPATPMAVVSASAAPAVAPSSPGASTDSSSEAAASPSGKSSSGRPDSGRPPMGPGGLVTYKRRKRGRRPSAQAQREKRETKRSVYLSPLPNASTFETVSELLQPFGRLQTVEFIEDGKSCYARFESYPQADRATEAGTVGDGVVVLPKKVRVEEVKGLQESLAALDAEKRLLQERLGPLSAASSATGSTKDSASVSGSNNNNDAAGSSGELPPTFSRTAALRGGRGHQRHQSGPAAGSRFGSLRNGSASGAAAGNNRDGGHLGVGESRPRRKGSFESHQRGPGNPERSGASTLPRREQATRGRRNSKERRPSNYGVGSGGSRAGNRRLSVEQLESNWRGGGSSHRRALSDNSNGNNGTAKPNSGGAGGSSRFGGPASAQKSSMDASAAPSPGAYQPPAQRQKQEAAAAAVAAAASDSSNKNKTAITVTDTTTTTTTTTTPTKLSQQAKPKPRPQTLPKSYAQHTRHTSTNIPVVATPPRGVPENVRSASPPVSGGGSGTLQRARTASAPGGAPPGLQLRTPPKKPQQQQAQALSMSGTSQLRPRVESASASSSPPKPGGHVILNGPASGMKAATGLAAVSVASKKKSGSRRGSVVSGTAAGGTAASAAAAGPHAASVNIAKGPDGSKGFKWSHNPAYAK